MDLHTCYEISIAEDRMSAKIMQLEKAEEFPEKTAVYQFLKENGVRFGILEEAVDQVTASPLRHALTIAEGTPPVKGEDAVLLVQMETSEAPERPAAGDVNLKNVMTIPTLDEGEMAAEKKPAGSGIDGTGVDGEIIPAESGKDFKLRPGKNTIMDKEGMKLTASKSGQLTVEETTVHILPVFEVKGDLDLRTGNIEFNGNVTIFGSVPSGFHIKARGDIRVQETVEGAFLESRGSIFIQGGAAAQGEGRIQADKDIHAGFINQASVECGGNLHIKSMILQSDVVVHGTLYADKGKGSVSGGTVSCGRGMIVRELGTKMHTPTAVFAGGDHHTSEKQRYLEEQMAFAGENLKKLFRLQSGLEKKKKTGRLSSKEEASLNKVETSIEEMQLLYQSSSEQKDKLEETVSHADAVYVDVEKVCYPNVSFQFGKYRRKINVETSRARFFIESSEIKFQNL
ncbi:DUF342 domain-containing protein [Alkalicoccus urumqiensis]|uniref:Flagellar Assembly Protein A N-terminal region domain-containing protein n=1 Tax=Alkalicoccus urumqiensis TaxID=1548213 RepID=A0A2P6MFY6_ALKUR|nr:FapA family protein [Alkalicoccus urumqiensis]PRO65205.1 hypothetical protein C6I21_10385 [Alkalicoccus urumqiensis]